MDFVTITDHDTITSRRMAAEPSADPTITPGSTYASADLLVFTSRTDTLGQVILEAQASGLPVVAVAEGGPRTLIEDGRSARLCEPDPAQLASTICELAARSAFRRRLATGALSAVRRRSWERSLGRLGDGYKRVLNAAEARRTAA